MSGVALRTVFTFSSSYLYLFFGLASSICFFIDIKYRRFVLVIVFGLFFGWMRMAMVEPDCSDEHQICSLSNREVVIEGIIASEPDRRIEKTNYIIESSNVPGWQANVGKVLLIANNYPEYFWGDVVRFTCRLSRPENNEDQAFRYDMHLAKDKIFIVCRYPIDVRKIGQTTSGLGYLFILKERIAERINLLWPEPESSFMAGILYGSRSGLPSSLRDAFAKTGITHIVAVSGYNISVITKVFLLLLLVIGFWRRQSFWITLGALVSFTLFTGASASVVRAAVMGALALIGDYIGRPSSVGTSLVVAATIMVAVNPYILRWDIGFQLSFLSTAGLVYVGPIVKKMFGKMTSLPFVGEVLTATISAQIATLPLILYYFGQLSLVAPLVNILVLWLIPWLMLAGFIAIVVSWLYFPIGAVIAAIAYAGLRYVVGLAEWFGNQSWSATTFSIPGWFMVLGYLFILLTVNYGKKNKSLRPTERL